MKRRELLVAGIAAFVPAGQPVWRSIGKTRISPPWIGMDYAEFSDEYYYAVFTIDPTESKVVETWYYA